MTPRNLPMALSSIACAMFIGFAVAADATEAQANSMQDVSPTKVGRPATPQGVQTARGAAIGASRSELAELLNFVVAPPSVSEAYAMSLVSFDRKSTVAVEARNGTKTISLSTTQSGSAPAQWRIGSLTTELERRQIVGVLSKVMLQPSPPGAPKALEQKTKR